MPGVIAFLKPMTPEARACLGGSLYKIPRYPLRVGRESRVETTRRSDESRRRSDSVPNNDVYLFETGPVFSVSREHFQIELRSGDFYLVDRGSACGTLVEGETVGDDRQGGERRLENNDVIIVGTSESRYVIKFIVAELK